MSVTGVWCRIRGVRVRFNFRLRMSRSNARLLVGEADRCRWVWNQCVGRSRDLFAEGVPCGPAVLDRELTDWRQDDSGRGEWLRAGSSVAQQQTIREFGLARSKAIKDIASNVPGARRRGLPTFHAKADTRPSLNYTRSGFKIADGRLVLAGGISVPVVWSRELPSEPSSVRVSQDACGHWSASFVVDVDYQPLPATGEVIGVDWGVTDTAVTTDPTFDLPHRQRGRSAAAALKQAQRKMARRRPARGGKGSAGYQHAKAETARLYAKVSRQRREDHRKWAVAVVRAHDQIAVEDFKPRFLARSTMARKAADAAIGAAKAELVWQATKTGRDLRLVDPKHTTMDCGDCGARTKHRLPLSERTYTCCNCGVSRPRDRNSATVMVARAGFDPASADRIRLNPPPAARAA